jgi:hypothetical protein
MFCFSFFFAISRDAMSNKQNMSTKLMLSQDKLVSVKSTNTSLHQQVDSQKEALSFLQQEKNSLLSELGGSNREEENVNTPSSIKNNTSNASRPASQSYVKTSNSTVTFTGVTNNTSSPVTRSMENNFGDPSSSTKSNFSMATTASSFADDDHDPFKDFEEEATPKSTEKAAPVIHKDDPFGPAAVQSSDPFASAGFGDDDGFGGSVSSSALDKKHDDGFGGFNDFGSPSAPAAVSSLSPKKSATTTASVDPFGGFGALPTSDPVFSSPKSTSAPATAVDDPFGDFDDNVPAPKSPVPQASSSSPFPVVEKDPFGDFGDVEHKQPPAAAISMASSSPMKSPSAASSVDPFGGFGDHKEKDSDPFGGFDDHKGGAASSDPFGSTVPTTSSSKMSQDDPFSDPFGGKGNNNNTESDPFGGFDDNNSKTTDAFGSGGLNSRPVSHAFGDSTFDAADDPFTKQAGGGAEEDPFGGFE